MNNLHRKYELNQPHFLKSAYMKDTEEQEVDEQTKKDELEQRKEMYREKNL